MQANDRSMPIQNKLPAPASLHPILDSAHPHRQLHLLSLCRMPQTFRKLISNDYRQTDRWYYSFQQKSKLSLGQKIFTMNLGPKIHIF